MRGTCFVVMGFGKKTDFESGRTLDLDKSYKNVIKPAVEAAGLTCIRADEIVHSGVIDLPMYEKLLNAEVVVADLSTNNKNAFYELGVRHALRPHTTLVICEDGVKAFPFDINHVVVRQYHHLGEDIGYSEVERVRKLLTDALTDILSKSPSNRMDSPVYTFLPALTPPGLSSRPFDAVAPAAVPSPPSPGTAVATSSTATHSYLMQQVETSEKEQDFIKAKTLLEAIRDLMRTDPIAQGRPEDPYIIQRLAFLTYKSKHPTVEAALMKARELLISLNPATSNDTETLGLWGAVHKRLWEVTTNTSDLSEAIRAHERGFYLRNDYYNGINLAYLLNVRADQTSDMAEAVTDFVLARRVRREVIYICDECLSSNPEPSDSATNPQEVNQFRASRYWVLATRGEAMFGMEDPSASQQLDAAYATAPKEWMKKSTQEQISKLAALIATSPLKSLHSDG